MNNYILSYNPLALTPSAGQILNHVKINKYVVQYWQPFPGTYFIKSNQPSSLVNDSFKGFFEGNIYTLIEFSAQFSSGSLPQEIWNWINHGQIPPPPPAPVAKPALTVADGFAAALREFQGKI